MGKRSDFKRIERDSYNTPEAAVTPLLRWLDERPQFIEPCCGEGCLIGHLTAAGHVCVGSFDLPVDARRRALRHQPSLLGPAGPPALPVENLSDQAPAWLLLSAD
jgi:hypothetical protein